MLLGVIDPHVSPEGTLSETVTVPPKPFTALTEMVAVDEDPGATAAGDVVLSPKSWKLNVAIAVWTNVPLVAVIARR